jgi:hypothetical protein
VQARRPPAELTMKESELLDWQIHGCHGEWGPDPISKLTPFKYWSRMWEVRVSMYAFMGWGLFCLQAAEARDELLSFIGRMYSKAESKALLNLNPRFIRYVLKADQNVYQDGDVEHGNVAGWSHIANILWEYCPLPRPWNRKEWGYTMTVASKDIAASEELFTYYPVN